MAFDTETNPVANETAAAGIGVQGNEVSAADLFAPEANGTDAPQSTAPADVPAQRTEERRFTSDDMSRAVQNRLKQERRGAAYTLGRELLDEYMTANNLSEADALAKIREDRIKQKAAQFKADPEKGFAELMRQRQYTGEDTQTPEARVDRLYNDIVTDIQSGKVPQGFDLNAYLSNPNDARDFIDLYEQFGMERACAFAMRMNAQTPSKAEQNRALPKPINTNNSYTPAQPDVWAMSAKDFAEMEKRMKKARAQGKRGSI